MSIQKTTYDTLLQKIKTFEDYFNDVVQIEPSCITDQDKSKIADRVFQLRHLQKQVSDFVQGKPAPFAHLSELEIRAVEAHFIEINELIDQHPILQAGESITRFFWGSDSEEELEAIFNPRSLSGRVENLTFAPTPFSSSPTSDLSQEDAPWGDRAPLVKQVEALENLISLLQKDGDENFAQAMMKWEELGESDLTVRFQLTKGRLALVADRMCYHLYCIHKGEQPALLVPDIEYGKKAMAGIFPATNADRIRAVQRTLAEAILEGLEDALNFEDENELRTLLLILETLELDPRDALPRGNLAKELFQTLVAKHYMNSGCSLSNESDLGRWAFYQGRPPFQIETKVEAIQMIREMLGTAWKLM